MTPVLPVPDRPWSYSSLTMLRTCEMKWALHYREGYRPISRDNAHSLRGSAWHALMQANLLVVGADRGTLLERPEKLEVFHGLSLDLDWDNEDKPVVELPGGTRTYLAPATICQAVDTWWKHTDAEERTALEFELGAPLASRLWSLWKRYEARWGEEDQRYDPLLTEVTWARTTDGGCPLTGRVDAVVRDTVRRLVVVRDYKTHASWPSYSEATADLMNSQLHLNAWGLELKLVKLGAEPARAVEYDRMRWMMCGGTRRQLPAPTWTKAGTLAATPTDYDEQSYREACAAQGFPVDEILIAKNCAPGSKYSFAPNDFFRRHLKPVSHRLIEQHLRAAEHTAKRGDGLSVSSASISPSENCDRCSFLALCQTQMISGLPDPLNLSDYGLRRSGSR